MRCFPLLGLAIGALLATIMLAACSIDGVTPDCGSGQCNPGAVEPAETSVPGVPEASTEAGPGDAGTTDARDAADARG